MFWKKACDCESGGVQVSRPNVIANEKDCVVYFSITIAVLECSVCGKAYDHVERPKAENGTD